MSTRLLGDIDPKVQRAASVLAWATWHGVAPTAVLLDGLHTSSVTDNAQGQWTITWSRAIAPGTDYAVMGFARRNITSSPTGVGLSARSGTYLAPTSVAVSANEMAADALVDCSYVSLIAVGAP